MELTLASPVLAAHHAMFAVVERSLVKAAGQMRAESFLRFQNNDCRKVCKRCGEDWGTPTETCFVRDHNLVEVGQPSAEDTRSLEETEEADTDTLLPSKHVRPVVNKRKRKIVEMLERYPPVITYHMF